MVGLWILINESYWYDIFARKFKYNDDTAQMTLDPVNQKLWAYLILLSRLQESFSQRMKF